MPVADYAKYCEMLDRARKGKFAYPAINVTSLTTANAVLKGLADSKSDGIIQVSTGGGAFASGAGVKDMVLGAISIAEHVHRAAARYPIYVALHTDHCQADKLDTFVIPLVEETERRRAADKPNLFTGHMFDGSALPLTENLDIAVKLLERFKKSDLILEIEAGVVGHHQRVAQGFRELLMVHRHRIRRVDATGSAAEVQERLRAIIEQEFELFSH
jgi:fructose-bisphosphate aldolase class II